MGVGVGSGLGVLVGDGEGDAVGSGVLVGDGEGDAVGSGVLVGDGEGDGVGSGVAVADGVEVGVRVGVAVVVLDGAGRTSGACVGSAGLVGVAAIGVTPTCCASAWVTGARANPGQAMMCQAASPSAASSRNTAPQ